MRMIRQLFLKNKTVLAYGISLALLLVLLNWLELRFIIFYHSFEIYIGSIAIIYTRLINDGVDFIRDQIIFLFNLPPKENQYLIV